MGSEIQSEKLLRDPMRSKIYCRDSPWGPIGSWIQYLLHLVERSSGIIDPTWGSTDMSAERTASQSLGSILIFDKNRYELRHKIHTGEPGAGASDGGPVVSRNKLCLAGTRSRSQPLELNFEEKNSTIWINDLNRERLWAVFYKYT